MPGMNGDELSLKLLEWYPEMKVLYTSGYGIDHIMQYECFEERINFIEKPFSVRHLLKKVRIVLD